VVYEKKFSEVSPMKQDDLLRRLFLCDGGPHSLSSAMSARSGSGKTTLLSSLISQATKMEDFKEQRFVYCSLKHENPFPDAPVVTDRATLKKTLRKNRIVVFYPLNPEQYERDIDDIIEAVFDLAHVNEDTGFHLTIDDSNILKGFSNTGRPSGSVMKLAIAGRSKGVRGLFITHRLGNLPRIMNSNLSSLLLLSMNASDNEYAQKVFGLDFTDLISDLTAFRWSVVDLIEEKIHRFDPIAL